MIRLSEVIKSVVEDILSQVKTQPPRYYIPKRGLKNTTFDETKQMLLMNGTKSERKINDITEIKAFMQTSLVLRSIYEAIVQNDHPSVRDLFYYTLHAVKYNITPFESQSESDAIIRDVEVMTGILREELGLVAEAKGSVTGKIVFESEGNYIDCSKMGIMPSMIPSLIDRLEIKSVKADKVLVVEKGAILERMNATKYWDKINAIIITGGGQPDRATRRLVRRLNEEWGLPVYVLTDSDPYGFYIYSVYKIGSISLAYESKRLACPSAKFLGLSVSDLYKYNIKNAVIKANETDIKRAQEMKSYPWFKDEYWQKELDLFLKKKEKAELEVLNKHGYKFMSDIYIPQKLKEVN